MSNVGAARKKEQADSKRIYDEELGLDVTPKDLLQPPDMEDMGGAASGRDSPLSRHSSQSAESRGSMARGVGAAASQVGSAQRGGRGV